MLLKPSGGGYLQGITFTQPGSQSPRAYSSACSALGKAAVGLVVHFVPHCFSPSWKTNVNFLKTTSTTVLGVVMLFIVLVPPSGWGGNGVALDQVAAKPIPNHAVAVERLTQLSRVLDL